VIFWSLCQCQLPLPGFFSFSNLFRLSPLPLTPLFSYDGRSRARPLFLFFVPPLPPATFFFATRCGKVFPAPLSPTSCVPLGFQSTPPQKTRSSSTSSGRCPSAVLDDSAAKEFFPVFYAIFPLESPLTSEYGSSLLFECPFSSI